MNTRFKVFASNNILQYLCDFIHVLIFVIVSKCWKNPKLTNIVIVLVHSRMVLTQTNNSGPTKIHLSWDTHQILVPWWHPQNVPSTLSLIPFGYIYWRCHITWYTSRVWAFGVTFLFWTPFMSIHHAKTSSIHRAKTPLYQYGSETTSTQTYKLMYSKILTPWHTHQIPTLD